jgi:hypothetical protein
MIWRISVVLITNNKAQLLVIISCLISHCFALCRFKLNVPSFYHTIGSVLDDIARSLAKYGPYVHHKHDVAFFLHTDCENQELSRVAAKVYFQLWIILSSIYQS